MISVRYDLVPESRLEDAIVIERAGYPEDEAGTLQAFKDRQSSAPELFLGAYTVEDNAQLIGYICATLSSSQEFSMEPYKTSETDRGPYTVCIHSLCVDSNHRRQGVASALMSEYLHRLEGGKYEAVLLIAHEDLIPFYVKAGFELVGKSAVVHGSKPWFQLRYYLPQTPLNEDMQLRIMQALKEQQSRAKSSRVEKLTLLSFSGGVSQLVDGDNRNRFDILCPRPGCSSIILKSGSTTLTERPSVILDKTDNLPPPDLLPQLPSPLVPMWTWKIGPPANPMIFENIGFSRDLPGVTSPPSNNPITKLLTCAECDLGPLGWCEQGESGMTYWLVCNRLGYK